MDPEPGPVAQHEQLQAALLGEAPDLDLDLDGLQLLDPPDAVPIPDGYTALHAAAEAGRLEEVQQLLAASRANLNARNADGSTPLHLAVRNNHASVVTALLESGANRYAKDGKDRTPLHVAASRGATAAMAQLMTVIAKLRAHDTSGNTPLHLACSKGMLEAARLLLDSGAPVNRQRAHRYRLLPNGTAQRTRRSDGYTPLHAASERGNLDVVRLLLGAEADVNLKTKKGWTALFLAIRAGHALLAEELLAAGANTTASDKQGWGSLHAAAHLNRAALVQRLLQLPAVVAAVDAPAKKGATPMYLACESGHSEVVGLLVAAGANMHRPAMHGQTPFHAAILCRRTALVQQLLAAGADPGAASSDGRNSLHAAAAAGHVPTLQMLLAAAAAGQGTAIGINDQAQGMSALQWAVERKHLSCVEVLLAAGADPHQLYGVGAVTSDRKSLAGASILHGAVQKGFAGAVPLLATPSNLSCVWNGKTPLQLAMALGTRGSVLVAHALLAAGARPWVADQAGVTPVTLALTSNTARVKGLLPAMVRSECVLYQQQQVLLQEGVQGQGGHQPDLAAVLECVRALAEQGCAQQAAACISEVMNVLGAPAAGNLVQGLLQRCFPAGEGAPAGGISTTQLVIALHKGWLAALKPTLQMDKTSRRLQRLVAQPLQQLVDMHWQQQQQLVVEGGAVAAAPAAAAGGAQADAASRVAAGLYARGAAAAVAGQWGAFMVCLEQLTAMAGWAPDEHSGNSLFGAAEVHVRGSWAGVAGLCEALLVAWWEARRGVTARARGEMREVVLAGVEAWHQLQLQQQWVVGDNKRR
jgi:cytohesin